MGREEIADSYKSIIISGAGSQNFHIIPEKVTLQGYAEVFLLDPSYLSKFWSSMFISVTIVVGQTILSIISGYGLSKFRFPGKNIVLYLIMILMILPVQVTLVPNYILLDKIGLIGSYWAVILPGIFNPFGVFLMKQVFSSVPDECIEAAKIDGANQIQILLKIVIPMSKTGIASLIILSFIDAWNLIEQPLAFLKDQLKYPLSIFLSRINEFDFEIEFVCGVLAILPVLLLFLLLKDQMIKGIEHVNMK
ncbi:MAG: carbohydrate ABC transporter permease [Clostridium sp.]|nr:carbohydrate ABC transporter permease [Clostridium sp.]